MTLIHGFSSDEHFDGWSGRPSKIGSKQAKIG
jgi:hypothetical protein